jgi:hypothetical protein
MDYLRSRTGAPGPEGTGSFPDWVVLDRDGRTICHDADSTVREAVKNYKSTAVQVHTTSGPVRLLLLQPRGASKSLLPRSPLEVGVPDRLPLRPGNRQEPRPPQHRHPDQLRHHGRSIRLRGRSFPFVAAAPYVH